MAIPSQPTTAISLGPTNTPTQRSISNEFGDTAPYQLDQYRRPSPLVPTNPANAPIPASPGQPISFSQFNGTTSAPGSITVNYTVTASNNDFDLLRYATSPNRPAPTRYTAGTPGYAITFTIANNVIIGSQNLLKGLRLGSLTTNTSGPANWHPDVTITINNQGAIVGAPGKGGDGSPGVPTSSLVGTHGYIGGTALNIQRPVTIYNNPGPWARIAGGGGGGAGGGAFNSPLPTPSPVKVGGGGGGSGSGIANTSGGLKGTGTQSGQNGGPSTSLTTPQGVSANGIGGTAGSPQGTRGGTGGQWGAAGQDAPVGVGSKGGAAGYYSKGDAQVTWQATGTRQGSVAPQSQAPLTTIQYQLIANTGVNLYTFATQPARPAPTLYAANQPGKRLEFTIGPGVIIGAAAIGGTAIVTGGPNEATNFHPDNEIVIINQGYIVGGAGQAGNGRPAQPGQGGSSGGTAIAVSYKGNILYVQNAGEIRAGGGGGGASGGYPTPSSPANLRFGAGGGAGAGQVGPGRGTGQTGVPGSNGQPSSPGQPAPIIASPGQGGTTQNPSPTLTYTGGAGGNWGASGQSGQPSAPFPSPLTGGNGGAPGYYGQGAIIWAPLGTVQGTAPDTSTVG